MKRVYFDQAATSFPKAPGVADAMKYYLDNVGASVNRGVYSQALSAEEVVYETREALCRLFHFPHPENVIFTLNITQSLNILLKGILHSGDHCVVSSMEHNAVMRPLSQLMNKGVSLTKVQASPQGYVQPHDIKNAIRRDTKVVVINHASNVCGIIQPLSEIGQICRDQGIFLIVDSAQTAGSLPIDFQNYNISALAFTGHKGLLGPQGIGGFLISKEMDSFIDPLITGGTGSLSDREDIPPHLPDKYEAGTPNIPGIFGLHASLEYLEKEGIETLHDKSLKLTSLFLEGINDIKEVELIGPQGMENRTSVVSLNFRDKDNGEIAYLLDKEYGIMTRSGLHCAPSAHQTLGTFPHGTVRFSFNHFNTDKEIYYALESINKLLRS